MPERGGAIAPDGHLKWKYKTGSSIESSPAISRDGTIYIGSFDGSLYALTPNGHLKWKFTTPNAIYSSPSIATDGTIYIGSEDNNLYAVH